MDLLHPTESTLSLVDAANAQQATPSTQFFDGPISGEMWHKVKGLNSKMPDTFNWKIYDDLYNKFGETQPRGGVVFKTGLKLVNHHSSCSKCHYAFEIDTYGRGCVHNCHYCYAKAQLTSHGSWNVPHPFPLDMAEVRKIFHTVFETDGRSKWRDILEKRIPLRIGSMSDSFMKMDVKYGVTKELLKILSFYNYPYIVFTRSDLVADKAYVDLLRKDLCSIQFSICGNDERLTKMIEPGAPSVTKRFAALKKLNEEGFWTTVRINPFFPIHPDGYFTNPDIVAEKFGSIGASPQFNLFNWDMLDQIKESGTKSFLTGVVRLSGYSVNQMSAATGTDIRSFFDLRPGVQNGDLRYSDKEVAHYYSQFRREAWRRGLRFSTCYIGMGAKDYYQYQNLWANKGDCCDAKGNVSAFQESSQSIEWSVRHKHAPHKDVASKAHATEVEMDKLFAAPQVEKRMEPQIEIQI